jgi:carboxypeptidase Q
MRAASRQAATLALGVALLVGACGGATSPDPAAIDLEALRNRALADPLALELVTELVNTAGARPAGSPGDAKATLWARERLASLGFENVRVEPVTVQRWERGANTARVVLPAAEELVTTALGGSVATPAGGLEAPVLRVTSLDEVRALPAEGAAGKIVFIDERMAATRDASGYGKAVAKRGAGASEAARKGAVALLIRSAGTSTRRVAHTGAMRYQDDAPRIPAASLSNVDADRLAELVAAGGPVTVHLELATQKLPDGTSANVLGEIRGREKPEEIVLLGCHLDSWDLGQGAQDDGAGCAIVMASAKLVADLPVRPRRTLRVVLYANEEFGLAGARAYAEAHAGELDRHVAAFEADLGAGKVWSFTTGVPEDRLPAVREIASWLAPLGIELGGNDGRGGADLSPLRPAGVPLFGLWQDATRYFDVHHTADDTLEFLDAEGLAQNVAAHTLLAWGLAEHAEGWGRAPVVESSGSRR